MSGWTLAVVLSVAPGPARGERFPEGRVPGPLRDWIAWALDGAEDRLCPAVAGSASCLWPGRLALALDGRGGSFALDLHADRVLDVRLPGDERRWPQAVRLDGSAAAVLEKNGAPALRVGAGAHRIDGRFAWERLPDSLPVPPAIALVDLAISGRAVPLPRREEDGLLILRLGEAAAGEAESLAVKVFRRLEDGIPVRVETRLALEVSGKAREVSLRGALLPGSVALGVSGELPARLDADGALRVQVRGGSFSVTVLARCEGRPERLARPATSAPWPDREVWVFAADERLRLVQLSGAPPIDPSQTELPEAWRGLPAFLLEGESALAFAELRRGDPDPAPDRLTLARRLWLDESGEAFTTRDSFSGQLARTTRLNLKAPAELGRVAVDGRPELVTEDPRSRESGVELRKSQVALEADSRLPRGGALSAVGWGASVQALRAELMLPPGWRLLATRGVDRAAGSWAGSWDLFAFFLVLLVAIGSDRLLGRRWGALALVTLVLLHGEPGAPRLVWLFLLAALALLAVAPAGILRTAAKALWWASVLVLALALVPFAVGQVRQGLFPQTGWAGGFGEAGLGQMFELPVAAKRAAPPPPAAAAPQAPPATVTLPMQDQAAPEAPAEAARQLTKEEAERLRALGYVEGGTVAPSPQPGRYPRSVAPSESYAFTSRLGGVRGKAAEQRDPRAVIQTGAGVPSWSWRTHALTWSGPVAPAHRMRLLLLSPGMNLLLALLRVGLAALLALRFLAGYMPRIGERLRGVRGLGAVFGLAVFVCAAPAARAEEETPSPQPGGLLPGGELLEQLRERLTRAPDCAPDCVATARLELAIEGGTLRVTAEVHAGAATGWPIPGPAASWVPRSVSADGQAAEGRLARFADGFLRVRVPPGVHEVVAVGPLPPRDSFALQFGEKPRLARASAPGWQVDGIREDGSADDSVQLGRRLGAGASRNDGGSYEPWLEVTRVFDVGVAWEVETVVRRVSPAGAPVVVKVPLLKGMLVTDAARQVQDGEVLVALGRDEIEARWSATLPPVEDEAVTLQAPEGRPWSEVWVVSCGAVWECDATGLPPVARFQDGRLAPEFRPWPGESLTLRFLRPRGAAGRTLTVDRASLVLVPGVRLEDATLELGVRASRTGPLSVTLPEGAEVQELKVAGKDRPARPEGRKLTLTIDAGEQPVRLAWRRAGGMGFMRRAPEVALSEPLVNASVGLQLPESRWLLLAGGPDWGPAVLFWPYLVVVLLAAVALARLPLSPLRTLDWVLLGLGLAQLPALGAALVAGWLLALSWRRGRDLGGPLRHDAIQLGLALLTLLALGFLYAAVHAGLLLHPDMQVAGGGSGQSLLRWYQDRTSGALPRPWVLSAPIWSYRVLMLLWSLWLASRLVAWLPWAWACFASGGLWKPVARRPPVVAPQAGESKDRG